MSGLRIASKGERPRRQHQCSVCGRLGVWGPGWQWYGSFKQLETLPESIDKVCSFECLSTFKEGKRR